MCVGEWRSWTGRPGKQVLQPYASVPVNDAQQLFKDAQLRIDRFSGFGFSLDALEVGVKREARTWAISLDSAR